MHAAGRVHQLPGDAYFRTDLPDAAFQHVPNAQLASDLSDIDGPPLVGEARISRDHEQPSISRQRQNDVFDDPVGKVVAVGIMAQVDEWQGSDRRPIRQGERLRDGRLR